MKIGETFQFSTGTFRVSEVETGTTDEGRVYGCVLVQGSLDPALSEFFEGSMLRVGERALAGIMHMQPTPENMVRIRGRLEGFFT